MNTEIDWQTVRRQVSIAGIVQDAETKQAIAGAKVEIANHPKWTITRVDGWFYFLDLPPKKDGYTLSASLPNRGTRYGVISSKPISVDSGRISPQSTNLKLVMQLPPTAMTGRIINKEKQEGVKFAKVQVQPGGETTLSDEEGNYFLSGLEAGSITIKVSAPGYQSKTKAASMTLGKKITIETIQLE